MADLVTAAEFAAFLDPEETTLDAATQLVLDQVEATLEAQCGRSERPFQAGGVRTERRDGTGSGRLYLDYPISALTSVTLGMDTSDPDDTLDVSDQTTLVWDAGKRKLERIDGGVFGCLPGYVTVVYTAADDLPVDAKLAVMHAAAVIHRQRGSEDAKAESEGGFRSDLVNAFTDDPIWRQAVAAHADVL